MAIRARFLNRDARIAIPFVAGLNTLTFTMDSGNMYLASGKVVSIRKLLVTKSILVNIRALMSI